MEQRLSIIGILNHHSQNGRLRVRRCDPAQEVTKALVCRQCSQNIRQRAEVVNTSSQRAQGRTRGMNSGSAESGEPSAGGRYSGTYLACCERITLAHGEPPQVFAVGNVLHRAGAICWLQIRQRRSFCVVVISSTSLIRFERTHQSIEGGVWRDLFQPVV